MKQHEVKLAWLCQRMGVVKAAAPPPNYVPSLNDGCCKHKHTHRPVHMEHCDACVRLKEALGKGARVLVKGISEKGLTMAMWGEGGWGRRLRRLTQAPEGPYDRALAIRLLVGR